MRIFGLDIRKIESNSIERDGEFMTIYDACKNYSMVSQEKMFALYSAVEYVVRRGIPGDFVECGVWKGGCVMLMAMTLKLLKDEDRKIYLYDTFGGMVQSGATDFKIANRMPADKVWKKDMSRWCFSSIDEVKENIKKTGYPVDNFVFVKGKVEETLLQITPKKISLLSLDTDWYESTRKELIFLYPLLSVDGVLIVDDYNFWNGSRKAVDDYFKFDALLFHRIDDVSVMIEKKVEVRTL